MTTNGAETSIVDRWIKLYTSSFAVSVEGVVSWGKNLDLKKVLVKPFNTAL